MPRNIYCASCGTELFFQRKALPKQQLIVTVVEPHKCKENILIPFDTEEIAPIEREKPKDLDSLFDSFKFVKKLNDLNSDPSTPTGVEDRRPKDDIRQPISSAPGGVLGMVKNSPNTTPEKSDTDLGEDSNA